MERRSNKARVFPRRTSYTPTDPFAFIGPPPLWLPDVDRVHVSCVFTWDVDRCLELARMWAAALGIEAVVGGPGVGGNAGEFVPGEYVRPGVTFTSRGCNNRCPWCLVPEREGKLRLLPITRGHIIQDNNFLQTPKGHRRAVYQMLAAQPQAAVFAGGLDARLIDDAVAEELRGLRIHEVYLAADTAAALPAVREAARRLRFLGRRKIRCYALVGFNGETVAMAAERLEALWEFGALPFAQYYQPPESRLRQIPREWQALVRQWSRPAAMYASHRRE